MRTMLTIGLLVLLLAVALPALASTDVADSGVTLINDDVLAPAGTPHATMKYVEATTGTAAHQSDDIGGSRNIVA